MHLLLLSDPPLTCFFTLSLLLYMDSPGHSHGIVSPPHPVKKTLISRWNHLLPPRDSCITLFLAVLSFTPL